MMMMVIVMMMMMMVMISRGGSTPAHFPIIFDESDDNGDVDDFKGR